MSIDLLVTGMFPHFIPEATKTVGLGTLIETLNLVRSLPCTTLRCKGAARYGNILCPRCEAVRKLEALVQ